MPRLRLALPLVAVLFAAPVLAESAKEHATAAKKAEKSKSYKKALDEWQAAYKIEPNAEYLIGMGDAYAKLGDKANAKKQYEAYLADPLSMDTDVVKGKLATLDKGPAGGDDLGLDLAAPAPKAVAAVGDLGLDLSGPPDPKGKKKDKKAKKGATADLGLDLAAPGGDLGLDLAPPPGPAAKKEPAKVAAGGDLGLDLAPPPGPAAKKEPAKVAAAAPADLGLDLGVPPAKGAKPGPAVAMSPPAAATPAPVSPAVAKAVPPPATPAHKEPPKTVAAATPPPKITPKPAPQMAISASPGPRVAQGDGEASGAPRIVAYATAGLAVGAFAMGGLYYSKASQDSTNVTTGVHPGNEASALLEQQRTHKSLAFAGLAGGLVLAGVAAALFAF